MANTGTIGILSYSILVGASIFVLRKYPALLAGYVSILVTNFFGFSVVIISLFSFILPAIAVSFNANKKEEKNQNLELDGNQKIYITGIVVISGFLLLLIGRYWQADYFYQKGIVEAQKGQYEGAIKDVQTAIDYSPTEPIYHNQMARIFTDIALGISKENKDDAKKFVPFAISESDIAYDLSPRNMNIAQTRMSMYLELAEFNPLYLQLAVNLIKDTIPLSPTDPKLELILGKAYANMGQIKNAKEALNNALELKPDYIEAKKDLQIVEKLQSKKE